MSGERRVQGDRRAPTTVSVRRLEGKVDDLATAVREDHQATTSLKADVRELNRQVGLLNPNGKATAILALADASGPLLELARVAPTIIAAVERDADMAAFWRVTRRLLNPLRPVGGLFWAVVATIVAALIWNYLTTHH